MEKNYQQKLEKSSKSPKNNLKKNRPAPNPAW